MPCAVYTFKMGILRNLISLRDPATEHSNNKSKKRQYQDDILFGSQTANARTNERKK